MEKEVKSKIQEATNPDNICLCSDDKKWTKVKKNRLYFPWGRCTLCAWLKGSALRPSLSAYCWPVLLSLLPTHYLLYENRNIHHRLYVLFLVYLAVCSRRSLTMSESGQGCHGWEPSTRHFQWESDAHDKNV
jgi:hypothetical protein